MIAANAIDKLVMNEDTKSAIKAIVKTYTDGEGQEKMFNADFIHGKGEGQIVLLHGPPGTGKTLTAGKHKEAFDTCTHTNDTKSLLQNSPNDHWSASRPLT